MKFTKSTFLILILLNCSFIHKENRPITNKMDEWIAPKSKPNKILLSPIGVSVGTISLLTDNFLVHPVRVLPKSFERTYEIIWEKPQGGMIRQTFLFVPKTVFTPFTFFFAWFYYASFGRIGSDGNVY